MNKLFVPIVFILALLCFAVFGKICTALDKPHIKADYSTVIDVDKFSHTLVLSQDGQIIATYDIIIGKPETPTPSFETTFNTIDINPTWHLTAKEIREMKKYPELKKKYGVIFTITGAYSPPSEKNPLGKARLNLQYQPIAIKIHGTSEPELFKTKSRHYSSGCIRVLEIQDLVQHLTSQPVDWTRVYSIKLDHPVHVIVH